MRLLFSILLILGLVSCIDEIDFDSPRNFQDAISIQARLVHDDPSVLDVEVKRLFDFTGIAQNIKVKNVELKNETQSQSMIAFDAGVNQYRIVIPEGSDEMDINYNDEYTLTIETFDDKLFVSTPEKLLAVPRGNQLTHGIIQKLEVDQSGDLAPVDYIQYRVNGNAANTDGELTRLRWSFEQAFKLIDAPEDPNIDPKTCFTFRNMGANIESVFDPTSQGNSNIDGFAVIDVGIDNSYADGNYMIAYQQSLTAGAYRYFNELSQLISSEGNLFDPPPGKIRSNFQDALDQGNEVFGYFYLTEIDPLRHFIGPDEVGNPDSRCPPFFSSPPPRPCFVESCCDCLLAPGSQLNKPIWWTN